VRFGAQVETRDTWGERERVRRRARVEGGGERNGERRSLSSLFAFGRPRVKDEQHLPKKKKLNLSLSLSFSFSRASSFLFFRPCQFSRHTQNEDNNKKLIENWNNDRYLSSPLSLSLFEYLSLLFHLSQPLSLSPLFLPLLPASALHHHGLLLSQVRERREQHQRDPGQDRRGRATEEAPDVSHLCPDREVGQPARDRVGVGEDDAEHKVGEGPAGAGDLAEARDLSRGDVGGDHGEGDAWLLGRMGFF
jgi:hypothetical protein